MPDVWVVQYGIMLEVTIVTSHNYRVYSVVRPSELLKGDSSENKGKNKWGGMLKLMHTYCLSSSLLI